MTNLEYIRTLSPEELWYWFHTEWDRLKFQYNDSRLGFIMYLKTERYTKEDVDE